ncbi:hypothetical protein [Flavobacterium sp. SM2513]|uniref:hypothetical protein n=1 Tax=Flavobacterium sp. SM2513 TaxID=3424766 RepID=UPI003D7F47C4
MRSNPNSVDTVNSAKIINLKSKITNPTFEEQNLFGSWATDLSRAYPEFEITEKSFYIKGNRVMRYEVNENKIKVFYPNFDKTGLIKKAINDSLIIYWASGEYKTYLRWNQ